MSSFKLRFRIRNSLTRMFPTTYLRFTVFDRFVCLLLILLLLANQAIAMGCPHEHSGTNPDSRQDRPHLHTGFHDHRHHEGHHPLDHYGQNGGCRHPQATSGHSHDAASCDAEVPCSHDCDAIYVSAQELHFLPTVQQDLANVGLASIAFVVVDWPQSAPSVQPIWPAAVRGPFSMERCALYLQILCLRI